MESMQDALTDRLAVTIGQALMHRADANIGGSNTPPPTVHDMARLCLAALGLDDLDAAAHRLAVAWFGNATFSGDERATIALQAALMPSELCRACGGTGESAECCPGAIEDCSACGGTGVRPIER